MTIRPATFHLPQPGDLGPDPEAPGIRGGAFHEGRCVVAGDRRQASPMVLRALEPPPGHDAAPVEALPLPARHAA